jgi:pilus assembly protein CpaF
MMTVIEVFSPDGEKKEIPLKGEGVIGKAAQNEIRLDSWRVAKEHARLFTTPSGVLIEDLGAFGGTLVNGKKVDQYGPLKPADAIEIGPYVLKIKEINKAHSSEEIRQGSHKSVASEVMRPVVQKHSTVLADAIKTESQAPSQLKNHGIELQWRKKIHDRLLNTMDLRRKDVSKMTDNALRQETAQLIKEIISDIKQEIPDHIDLQQLQEQVLHEAVGLGPLEELLADDAVTEIMVNRFDEIFIEKKGKLQRHPLVFTDNPSVLSVIERIVSPIGRRIDESSPMVDARLKDGSRVNAIIPPLALKGPTITIRKFPKRKLDVSDLQNFGSVNDSMAEFLKICVEARKNIVVSGGTGSGKTTLLNILSNFIPAGERVITIEDAAELRLHHEHLISLESRPANAEGKGQVAIRDLVKNALRMRPDRIVVGECRGAEALDMLQAMNTGHEGSLTTLHANTPRDALARLETMILMAGMDLPLAAIREQITSAVDIIVQQTRFSCGSRKVVSIVEVTGIESGKIQLLELFKFENKGFSSDGKTHGYFNGCDQVPSFYEDLVDMGFGVDHSIFKAIRASEAMNVS